MSELIQWPRARYWERAWNTLIGCKHPEELPEVPR